MAVQGGGKACFLILDIQTDTILVKRYFSDRRIVCVPFIVEPNDIAQILQIIIQFKFFKCMFIQEINNTVYYLRP